MPAAHLFWNYVSVFVYVNVFHDIYEYKMSPYAFIQHHYRNSAHTMFMFLAYANKHRHHFCPL